MKRLIKSAIKRCLALFNLSILRIPKVTANEISGEFVDSKGSALRLLKGYKESVWALNWKQMNEERAAPNAETVKKLDCVGHGRRQVDDMVKFLKIRNIDVSGKRVLDIGCFNGASSYALIERGAARVDAIDVSEHFVSHADAGEEEIRESSRWIRDFRQAIGDAFVKESPDIRTNAVNFYDLDIKDLDKVDTYDLILSWETFEHILDVEQALASMYRALRSNGICAHRYHPFFCESGAHFDTLDFPWGHARLSAEDFLRYMRTYCPHETDLAEWRFCSTVNRMTLRQLRQCSSASGFEIVEIMPVISHRWQDIDPAIFSQSKALYPSLTLTDLVSSKVWALLRKPSRPEGDPENSRWG
ncbi:MAG: class I SAM-dependent methyltransferase [Candidatus Omnitrophota bacterium]